MNGRPYQGALTAGGLAAVLLLVCFVTAGDTAVGAPRRSDRRALRLLHGAVDASRTTPYTGVRYVRAWSRARTAVTSLVKVEHLPGKGTTMRVRGGTAAARGRGFEIDRPGRGGPGLTSTMLDLLAHNYTVVRAGEGTVCGRSAIIIEAERPDGRVAGRFFVDRRTGLVLRRELLDGRGREVGLRTFTELRASVSPRAARHFTARPVEAPWRHRLTHGELGALRHRGWSVPTRLPGELTLYDARQRDARRSVIHLGYSDGLSTLSVFLQRGRLDPRSVAGWRTATMDGRTVYFRDGVRHTAVWSSRGYVYTVIADAPPAMVDAAVASLPHGGRDFGKRLSRGFSRIVSWVDPFS